MFYSIRGTVKVARPGLVVLENGGIGFMLTVSGKTLGRAANTPEGAELQLFTYLSVREDALELFGFYSEDELSVFKKLISVSGVGPKAAIAVLTALTAEELYGAVASGDYKSLTRAQGIGKRIAERIILELKDKLSGGGSFPSSGEDGGAVQAGEASGKYSDAESTLLVLGYGRGEIASALREVYSEADSLEDIIKKALKKLMK